MSDDFGKSSVNPDALKARANAAKSLSKKDDSDIADILSIVGTVGGAVAGPALGLDPVTGASIGGSVGRGVGGLIEGGDSSQAAQDIAPASVLLPGSIRIPFLQKQDEQDAAELTKLAGTVTDDVIASLFDAGGV